VVLLGKLNKRNANIGLLVVTLILLGFNLYNINYNEISNEDNESNFFGIVSNIILILLFSLNLRKIKKSEIKS